MSILVTEENKVTSNVGCVSAEFAQRETNNILWESLALVNRFERARSHDVNDPLHLINSDSIYLEQNDIIVPIDESLESD